MSELPERTFVPGDPLPLPPLPDSAYPPDAVPLATDGTQSPWEPVAEGAVDREYVVTGENHIVLGHLNGEKFWAVLPLAQEARLIKAGHIQRVEAEPADDGDDTKEQD